jgi:hypothetical protein
MGAERRDRVQHRLLDRQRAGQLVGKRGVGTLERVAERDVAENHPTGGARRAAVAFVPFVHQSRLDVQDLVRPALGDGGHPGVDGLGLEHKQLALSGALLRGVQGEARCSALDDRHRPGRVRVRAVCVPHEPGVQRLDPG